jgi:hypothetical protein
MKGPGTASSQPVPPRFLSLWRTAHTGRPTGRLIQLGCSCEAACALVACVLAMQDGLSFRGSVCVWDWREQVRQLWKGPGVQACGSRSDARDLELAMPQVNVSSAFLAAHSSRDRPVSLPIFGYVFSVYTAPVDGSELQAVTQVRGRTARMLL